jgi:hypothetical protein
MFIKLDPIKDVLRKNMSRLGFRQSLESQPKTKHLPKTKLEKKNYIFYTKILPLASNSFTSLSKAFNLASRTSHYFSSDSWWIYCQFSHSTSSFSFCPYNLLEILWMKPFHNCILVINFKLLNLVLDCVNRFLQWHIFKC